MTNERPCELSLMVCKRIVPIRRNGNTHQRLRRARRAPMNCASDLGCGFAKEAQRARWADCYT